MAPKLQSIQKPRKSDYILCSHHPWIVRTQSTMASFSVFWLPCPKLPTQDWPEKAKYIPQTDCIGCPTSSLSFSSERTCRAPPLSWSNFCASLKAFEWLPHASAEGRPLDLSNSVHMWVVLFVSTPPLSFRTSAFPLSLPESLLALCLLWAMYNHLLSISLGVTIDNNNNKYY